MTLALLLLGSAPVLSAGAELGPDDRIQLAAYARDTWRSMAAMAEHGDLPDDALRRTENGDWAPSGLSSPTDIAAYLWSTVAAEDLHVIPHDEARQRLGRTLAVVARLERSHGFFFNWYDTRTGAKALAWPNGVRVRPFLSSVDNGWLAAALMVVGNTCPEFHDATEAILAPMDFSFFYDPYDPDNPAGHPGLLRGGYWTDDASYASFHYGMLNTEPRIASYIGIARGNLPPDHYYRMQRSGTLASNDLAAPIRKYDGVEVVEGVRSYRGIQFVPSWDGTMFEALMVPLFVPEADWAPKSWGINHALYVQAQIDYGMRDARLGYWGVSAAADPAGGYRPYGIAALGAGAGANPVPSTPESVVTPHASFLALSFAPKEAMANLRGLTDHFAAYGPFGFHDSVDVSTKKVSDNVLALDQGMILAALSQSIGGDVIRRGFSNGAVETAIRQLISQERFEAGNKAAQHLNLVGSLPRPAAAGIAVPEGEPGTSKGLRRAGQ